MKHTPKNVIICSGRVMYILFDYEDTYNAGMSGAYLDDYYSIVGVLKNYDKKSERIVIGVDTLVFLRDDTDRRHISIKNGKEQNNISATKLKELYSFAYF